MTEHDQRRWLATLGPTRERQIAVLRELLRHAAHDEMSAEDRAICRAQLARLEEENSLISVNINC